jgi:hypothetical protein
MTRDILSEFGPEADKPQVARASGGGCMDVKNVPYNAPVGPTTFSHNAPGLANRNNYGNAGSQGKYDLPASTSGSPGITSKGGENEGKGTNG